MQVLVKTVHPNLFPMAEHLLLLLVLLSSANPLSTLIPAPCTNKMAGQFNTSEKVITSNHADIASLMKTDIASLMKTNIGSLMKTDFASLMKASGDVN